MVPTFVTRDNEIYINDLRRYAKGTIIVPDTANLPVVTAASSDSPPIPIEGPQDSISELYSTMHAHGASDDADVQARLAVMIRDIAYRRDLMNRHILVNHIFGVGQRPGRLQESLLLENQQTMTFEFRNGSALGSSNLEFSLEARTFQGYGVAHPEVVNWLDMRRKRAAYMAPYWLTTESALSIPVSATRDVLFVNTRDKFLLITQMMASVITTGSAGDEASEYFTCELWDAKTERKLMNQPVTFNTGFGTPQYPFILDDPLLIEPNTNLRGRFQSLITDETIEVFITLVGIQIMDDPAVFSPEQLQQPAYAGMNPLGR